MTTGTDCFCNYSAGLVINTADTQCVLCDGLVANCLTCVTSPTVYCELCQDPYYNDTVNTTTCLLCPIECASCVDPANCTSCIAGFTLSGGVCVCDDCSGCNALMTGCGICNTSMCFYCASDYFMNETSGVCELCTIGCSTCFNDTYCTVCSAPFILVNLSCECNTTIG